VQRAVVVLVRDGVEVARWPLETREHLDLAVIDDLARVQLGARRMGCTVRLERVCPQLRELLDLSGLRVEVER
jgi:ABC-type transporter Mla MlaB component